MLKKSITYNNPFTDEQVMEEHYFHISKADLVQMEMEEHGSTYVKDGQTLTGMQAKLQKIVDSQDGRAIMEELRDIIRRAYGKKDGDRFLKSKEIWDNFAATEAYSQLIFDLCTNADAAAEFMNGIIPNNLEKIAAEVRVIAETETETEVPMGPRPAVTSDRRSEPLDTQTGTDHAPGLTSPEAVDTTGLTNPITPRVLTQVEMEEMNADELKAGLRDGRYKLS